MEIEQPRIQCMPGARTSAWELFPAFNDVSISYVVRRCLRLMGCHQFSIECPYTAPWTDIGRID